MPIGIKLALKKKKKMLNQSQTEHSTKPKKDMPHFLFMVPRGLTNTEVAKFTSQFTKSVNSDLKPAD